MARWAEKCEDAALEDWSTPCCAVWKQEVFIVTSVDVLALCLFGVWVKATGGVTCLLSSRLSLPDCVCWDQQILIMFCYRTRTETHSNAPPCRQSTPTSLNVIRVWVLAFQCFGFIRSVRFSSALLLSTRGQNAFVKVPTTRHRKKY